MKIGSDAHKAMFCEHFLETYTDFDPDLLPWPDLDEASLAKLRGVPFWNEVLFTETRAGAIVKEFVKTVDDPLIRRAVEMQALEETRHAKLIRTMIARYDIPVEERPLDALPDDIVTAFKDFGFGECMDSFLGFGAFKVARTSEFLPQEMFDIFETLMFEETRHIVFFVNWMAWSEAQAGRAFMRPVTTLWFYMRAAGRMAGTVMRGQQVNDGKDFSATQASVFLDGFTFKGFVEDCYSENSRRMGALTDKLLVPGFLPKLAGSALPAMRLWNLRRPQAATAAAA